MIEENGHVWIEGLSIARCHNCQIQYDHYLDLKRESEEQPKRQDFKKQLKCKKARVQKEMSFGVLRTMISFKVD